MMGSAAGVDPTFDRVVDYYDLNSGKCDYREADSFYDEEGKKQGDFTLVYYIRKNEPHVTSVILQIVEENKSLRYHDQLTELKATYQSDGTYFLYGKGKMLARVKVENAGLLKKSKLSVGQKTTGAIGLKTILVSFHIQEGEFYGSDIQ